MTATNEKIVQDLGIITAAGVLGYGVGLNPYMNNDHPGLWAIGFATTAAWGVFTNYQFSGLRAKAVELGKYLLSPNKNDVINAKYDEPEFSDFKDVTNDITTLPPAPAQPKRLGNYFKDQPKTA